MPILEGCTIKWNSAEKMQRRMRLGALCWKINTGGCRFSPEARFCRTLERSDLRNFMLSALFRSGLGAPPMGGGPCSVSLSSTGQNPAWVK